MSANPDNRGRPLPSVAPIRCSQLRLRWPHQNTMQKLRHVRQRNGTDCGIACIRILTGAGDSEVRSILGIAKTSRSHRTQPEQVRMALNSLGFRMLRETHCDDWGKLPTRLHRGLLAVNYRESSNTWHWVVLDRADPDRPILDPKSAGRRAINRKSHLCCYYRVEPDSV